MSEYISREELKRVLKPFVIKKGVMENINAIPSADVRENIHGEWITQYDIIRNPYSEEHNPHTKCSECNFRVDTYSSQFMNFCPNCGADMRGGKWN